MSDASPAALYPRYCFHLSPTVNTWCPLRVSEIHDLDQHDGFEGENFYFYKNLPIKWVRIVGVVVAIDDFAGRRVYTLDDSSGACIETLVTLQATTTAQGDAEARVQKAQATKQATKQATELLTAQVPAQYGDIDVGAVVDLKGSLSDFRDERQIKIEKVVPLKSTTQEITLWEKRAKFRREVLDKPWVLRSRDIRRCRKEAERSEADVERKKRRLKAITEEASAKRHTKAATRIEPRNKGQQKASRDAAAVSLRDMIRDGAAEGKYNALGL